MRILVLGSDGYIGWPLTIHLLKRGHTVMGLDNLSRRDRVSKVGSDSLTPITTPQERKWYLKNNFSEYVDGPNATLGYVNPMLIRNVLASFEPDTIIHLAEQPSAPWSMIDPYKASVTQQENVLGTLHLLWAMKEECPDAHLIKLGCYDKETEVLTIDGWKYFTDLTIDDTICCIDKETENIEYHKPSGVYKFKYEGNMIECRTKSLDMKITPNHRVAYRTYTNNGVSSINIMEASELKNHRAILIPRSGKWCADDKEYFIIPSCYTKGPGGRVFIKPELYIPMDLWLFYLGHYIADGSIRCRPNPNTARIGVSKEYKINSLMYIKDRLSKHDINISVHKKKNGIVEFDLNNSQIASYLYQLGTAKDKYIPKEILDCSSRQLEILYFTLSLCGDGSTNTITDYFSTTSKKLADDFQELCLKIGKVANISESSRGELNISIGSKNLNTELHSDRISISKSDGYVYCCSVHTGIIMTRRNGKIAWSGNTMGEYGTPNCDIPEGVIPEECLDGIDYKLSDTQSGTVKVTCPMSGLLFPRSPGSFYHLSKVHDTHNVKFACDNWGLCSTDIMQGVLFGSIGKGELITRFDYDEYFGTVINRFCAQAISDNPLTIYGLGQQQRGFLPLKDSIQCINLAIINPPDQGEYRTFNQFEKVYSLNWLAKTVKSCAARFGLDVELEHINNPRKEMESHYYNPIHERLLALGYEPSDIEEEIASLIETILPFKDSVRQEVLYPKTNWR